MCCAACAPSLQEIQADADAHNRRSVVQADAVAARTGAGVGFEPGQTTATLPEAPVRPDSVTIAAAVGQHGLQGDERLLARTTDHELLFEMTGCARPLDVCGVCSEPVHYHYYRRADGHVVIVRLVPQFQTRRVEVEHCTIGECGIPMPPPPHYSQIGALDLGVHSLDQVELREVGYTQVVVEQTCKHPVPVP